MKTKALDPRLLGDDELISAYLMTMRKKSDLSSKICMCCGRPYFWRKKWAKIWDEVKYCSERCRRTRKEKP